MITIYLKSILISFTFSSFYLFSFFSPFVELLYLFVNDRERFYFFVLGIWPYKHKSYKNFLSMLIHVGLVFKV